jgi:hypothetical protein
MAGSIFYQPQNSIRQVAAAAKLNDLEIRRIIYGLLQAGLVEIVRLERPKPIIPVGRIPSTTASAEDQKSLINRIIGRIRSL